MAHPDLDRLLDFCVRFAQSMQARRGEFGPFAATVNAAGELKPLAIDPGDGVATTQIVGQYFEVLDKLVASGEVVATAVCYDGVFQEARAIAVVLEHSGGESVLVYRPYSKSPSGEWSYGSLMAVAGDRRNRSS